MAVKQIQNATNTLNFGTKYTIALDDVDFGEEYGRQMAAHRISARRGACEGNGDSVVMAFPEPWQPIICSMEGGIYLKSKTAANA